MKVRLRKIFESVLGADQPAPKWLCLLVCAALVFGGAWYSVKALAHGQMNNVVMEYNDQHVYVGYAINMSDPAYSGFLPRMRMPLYPWLLSFAARPYMSHADLFSVGQSFNIALSLVCLGALYLVLRRWLGNWFGLAFCLVAAFQLYVLRSGYVQPELLLTTLITVTLAWLVKTLHEPNWRDALISGLLLCAWYLTKSSAHAAFLMFLGVLGLKWIFAGRGLRRPYFVAGVVVIAGYLLPMTPYLYTSWKYFGDPFYNVQSKYYLWAENVDDKHDLQKLNLDRNLDKLPADPSKLPSRARYFERHKGHVYADLKARLIKGLEIMFKITFWDFSPFYFMGAVFAGAMLWAVCRSWPESALAAWRWKWEILYVVGITTAFTILFGWFTPIKVGPRLIEAVTLAPIFFCAAVAHWFLKDQRETIWGIRVSMEKLFVVLFLIFWAGLTIMQAPNDLIAGYFGG